MSESTTSPNAAQIDHWNAKAGRTWALFNDLLDRQIGPLGRQALAALAPQPGEHVLDIGCGCGATTIDLAARVGRDGSVTGVDLSAPMLAVARARTAPEGGGRFAFRALDAQTEDLGESAFDAAFSRFGVMFFSDPVKAFANVRAALRPRGRLAFVCWRALEENPWMQAPLRAALPLFPPLTPASDPTAPGPFAFADADRLRAMLSNAGFGAVAIAPFDARIGVGDVDEALLLALRVGPLGALLRENPERKDAAAAAVRKVLLDFTTPEGVRMAAGVWIVTARKD